jgi:hypothetical protein
MYLILFFIGLAFLGLVIYLFPKFVGGKVLESFAIVDIKNNTHKPYAGHAAPTQADIQKLRATLAAEALVPVSPTLHEIAQSDILPPSAAIESLIITPKIDVPVANTSTKSMPQQLYVPEKPSASLSQGKSFTESVAFPEQPKAPVQPPIQTCPPVQHCPNMSDYIRKDSIPCWSCKLN